VVALIGIIVVLRLAVPFVVALRSGRSTVLEYVDSALVAVVLVFCILRPFVVQAFYIPSTSMLDTLRVNDRILVNKFIFFFREPQVGDVIVFDAPPQATNEKKDFIKRVVGVAGDRIAVHDGHLYRNGVPIDEPYIKERPFYAWPEGIDPDFQVILRPGGQPVKVENNEVKVPEGYLMVFGDNRNDSNDSHKWDAPDATGTWRNAPFLPRENVLGKAFCIFWPPPRWGLIRSHPHPAAAAAAVTPPVRAPSF
jgi:signal peptidase I